MTKYQLLTVLFLFSLQATGFTQDGFYSKTDKLKETMSDYLYMNADTILISYQDWWTRDDVSIDINENKFSYNIEGRALESSKVIGEVNRVNDSLSYQAYIDEYKANWVAAHYTGTYQVRASYYNYKENMPVVSYDLYAEAKLSPDEIKEHVIEFLSAHRPNYNPKSIIAMDKYEISDHEALSAFVKRVMQPKKK